ncbi:hypothetical protein NPIL_88021 [Nephila pilipes]|uniref:Uncharacterized protein n=1 Tax=Nephila pilipes TaxID=299642 RepID=A0A8X6U229_NEPPI|nr:hypothetical protein NPIL_88021 [Nephila pilipes]
MWHDKPSLLPRSRPFHNVRVVRACHTYKVNKHFGWVALATLFLYPLMVIRERVEFLLRQRRGGGESNTTPNTTLSSCSGFYCERRKRRNYLVLLKTPDICTKVMGFAWLMERGSNLLAQEPRIYCVAGI